MNKLLQYMIGAGNVSDKYLPHLVKYQNRGEVKKSPLLDMSTLRPVYDNLPDPATMRRKAMDTVRVDNNAALKAIRQKQGELKPATSQGAVSKVLSVLANPVSAASYVVKGQRIPDYFDKAETKPYDAAIGLLNPVNAYKDIDYSMQDVARGDYGSAALNFASGIGSIPSTLAWARKASPKLYSVNERLIKNRDYGTLAAVNMLAAADAVAPLVVRTPGLRDLYKKAAYNVASTSGGAFQLDPIEALKSIVNPGRIKEKYRGDGIWDNDSKRDLVRQYIYGDSPDFEEIDLKPFGLQKYYDRYGNMKVFKLHSKIPHGETIVGDDFDYFRYKIQNASKNNDLVKEKGYVTLPVDANSSSNPVRPIDNVAGHMVRFSNTKTPGKYMLTSQDIWKFHPEDYSKKWHAFGDDAATRDYITYLQAKLLERAGKPFILMQENPFIWSSKYQDVSNVKKYKKGGGVSDSFLPLVKAQKGRTFPAETLDSRQKAYRTIRPSDYYEMSNYARWMFNNDREEYDDERSEEAFRMYLGMENKPKYFRPSKYKPTINPDPNPSTYYQVDSQLEQEIFNSFKDKVKLNQIRKANETEVKSEFDESDPNVWKEGTRTYKALVPDDKNLIFGRPMVSNARALGNFVVSRGKDKQGEYLSYSDQYDFPEWAQKRMQGQPYKIYGRVYYPKTKKQYGGVPVTTRGQYDYPGRDTIVPTSTGQITMQGVPYPVYGQDETGYGQMMMPGGEYQFPGQMVYEKPMMQRGGPAPLYVSDTNDSRLKNYEDSLYNYNLGRRMAAVLDADKNLFKVEPGSTYDKALQAKVKGAGNKFIDNSEIDAGGYKNFEKIGSIMKEYQRKGNKAILPIRYQGYFPDPDNSVVDMVTLRSVWDALGVTDPRPPGAANLPQWKKPERQVIYKQADPVPPAPRKTGKKPSGANTLFVNDPNDPRLKAYQDSLRVSSKHSDLDSPSFIPGNSDWVKFVRRANNIPADQKIDPIGIHADSDGIPVYKYPRRPVVYKRDTPQLATIENSRTRGSMIEPTVPQLSPNLFTQNNMSKSRAVDFWNPSMPGGIQNGWHRRLFDSMEEADNFMKYIRENDITKGYEVTNSAVNNDADRVSYKEGGEMIRRADGSYSKRGLWDNIRANKGSGKKPTKEMLKQERKIKEEDMQRNMAYGGYLPEMFFGGKMKKNLEEAAPMLLKFAPMLFGAPPIMQKGGEPDGAMALGQIDAAIDKLNTLRKFIQPESDLEPWVSSKLTLMDHYTDAVSDYMQYNPEAQGGMEDLQGLPMPEMKNGGGIPERYKNMGFNKVGVKKESTRPGKKWMVLAKKGDQYKVVHGGYDGMKDYTQHGSEKRRDRFWDRMGGKNSSKATDPFSPLYWHKRFGTWEDGGEIPEMKGGGSTWSGNTWYRYGGDLMYAQEGVIAPPRQDDYPDYESYAQAMDAYIQRQGELAARVDAERAATEKMWQDAEQYAQPIKMPAIKAGPKPMSYQGSSIVDMLSSVGKASDYNSRKQLAAELGITNYYGSAEQNKALMKKISSNPSVLEDYKPVRKTGSATSTRNRETTAANDEAIYTQGSNLPEIVITGRAKSKPAAQAATSSKGWLGQTADEFIQNDPYFFAEESDPEFVKAIDAPFTYLRNLGARTFYDLDPGAVAELLVNRLAGAAGAKMLGEAVPFVGKMASKAGANAQLAKQLLNPNVSKSIRPASVPATIQAPVRTATLPANTGVFTPLKQIPKQAGSVKRASAMSNRLKLRNKEYGGPMIGDEMNVTPEQLEMLKAQGYEFEIL